METILLFNGLGNQMSQYAFYIAKCMLHQKCQILVDQSIVSQHNGFELDRIFNVGYRETWIKRLIHAMYYKVQYGTRLGHLLERLGVRIIRESRNYDYDCTKCKKGPYLINIYKGGWHSEKYFKQYRESILSAFKFKTNMLNPETRSIKRQIENTTISVSLHVRRGDYLKKPWGIYDFSNVATDAYYFKAITYIKEHVGISATFFVFSDDISWCRALFGDESFVYVSHNKDTDSWQDMYLMTRCKWHINANSTFSWWGAWLSDYPENTIVPQKFLNTLDTPDVYPDSWIKI